MPALQSTRTDVSFALRSEGPGSGQRGHLRWCNALVVAQFTISLVLLVGAGLFLRSFQQVQLVDSGFGHEPAAILTFLTPATRFSPDEVRVYTRRLFDRFRELPGVDAVGAISRLHLSPLSTSTSDFNVTGFEPPTRPRRLHRGPGRDRPGFFEAAGIEIVRGRNFSDADRSTEICEGLIECSCRRPRRRWLAFSRKPKSDDHSSGRCPRVPTA